METESGRCPPRWVGGRRILTSDAEQRAQVGRTRGCSILGHVPAAGELQKAAPASSRQEFPPRTLGDADGTHPSPPARHSSVAPCPTLTPSAALSALAGCAILTGAGHAGYPAQGGAGSGTRRAGAPDQRDAGWYGELILG